MFERWFGKWVDVKKVVVTGNVGYFRKESVGVAIFQKNSKTKERRCLLKFDKITSYRDADVIAAILGTNVEWGE